MGPTANTGPIGWLVAFYPAVLPLYWPLVSFVWGLSQKKPDHVQICLHSCCTGLNRPTGEDVLNYRTGLGLVGVLIFFRVKEEKGSTLLRLFGFLNWTKPFLSALPDKISTAATYPQVFFCFFIVVACPSIDLFLVCHNVKYHPDAVHHLRCFILYLYFFLKVSLSNYLESLIYF